MRQHGVPDGVRYRHGQWLADGETLVAVSDETGEERVVVVRNGDDARRCRGTSGASSRCAPRRAGTRVAIANHRNEVLIGDVDAATLHGHRSQRARAHRGSRVVARRRVARVPVLDRARGIRRSSSTTSRAARARSSRQPEFRDYSPAFDPDGKYLYFLSLRTFDPVYDNVQFELSFPRAARPYLIALQADAAAAVRAGAQGPEGRTIRARRRATRQPTQPVAVRVDLDGIARRVAAFPVPEGRFGQIAGVAGDKVVWTLMPIAGAHGRGGHKELPGRLEVFDFAHAARPRRSSTRSTRFVARRRPRDARRSATASGCAPFAPTASPIRASARSARRTTPSRKSGWIDLGRVRVSVDPRREWRQMLHEVWRLQRDQFWVPDMSGIDWEAVYARYEPLLDARRDARRVLRPDLGDAGRARHVARVRDAAATIAGRRRWRSAISPRELELAADGASYEIARIVARRPVGRGRRFAAQRGRRRRRRSGERIVAVNGQPVSRERAAAGAARAPGGAKVELTLARGTRHATATLRDAHVVVTTLADEVPARYREWVERNRAWVHEQVEGPRRLPAPARHDVGGLRRVPSLLRHRMRPRRADRRRPLQPRRPRLAAAAREGRAAAHRLRPHALGPAGSRTRTSRRPGRSSR